MTEDNQFLLGRLDAKLDGLRASLEEFKEQQRDKIASLEGRLTAVERFQWKLAGVGGLVGSLASLVFTWLLRR